MAHGMAGRALGPTTRSRSSALLAASSSPAPSSTAGTPRSASTPTALEPPPPATPSSSLMQTGRKPLIDLGPLVQGKLIQRPSSSIKSPYVADVQLSDGSQILAWAPSLGCGGLAIPGSTVYMSYKPASTPNAISKTTHAIQVVEDVRTSSGTTTKVGYNSVLAERMAQQLLEQGLLQPLLGPFVKVETQRTFGKMRVDFLLHGADGSRTLLEVKSVPCADYQEGAVPPDRKQYTDLYTSSVLPYRPTAIFPHGNKKQNRSKKVVSDRAIKHVHELSLLQDVGVDSEGRRLRCAVLFIVNRPDCSAFRPCHEADRLFAQVLRRAQDKGVKLLAVDVEWQGGQAFMGKMLPVVFDVSVQTADIDEQRLAEVLEQQPENSRKRSRRRPKSEESSTSDSTTESS